MQITAYSRVYPDFIHKTKKLLDKNTRIRGIFYPDRSFLRALTLYKRPMTSKQVLPPEISHVIELAWDDQTSFEAILADTGLSQPQVIEIMRRHLKPSSFRMWRARVYGRQTKHAVRRGTRFRNVSED